MKTKVILYQKFENSLKSIFLIFEINASLF